MQPELNIVLLLDVATENPIQEAAVLAHVPAADAPTHVLRVSAFGATPHSTGTPNNWRTLTSAIDEMLQAARELEKNRRCRYWVAGRAGLPAFFHLGYRLSKKAVVTLLNPRDSGPFDVLPLDALADSREPGAPYFTLSSLPATPSPAQVPVALIVSSRLRVNREQVLEVMSRSSWPTNEIVEAQASGSLDAGSAQAAIRELDQQVAGIQRWYPRHSALSVFIAGPVTLAFLAGRALNPHIFPRVQVFQHRNQQYELAFETLPTKKRHDILFLVSNPASEAQANAFKQTLPFDEEANAIRQELRRSIHRDSFELQVHLAPRALDVRRLLQEVKPSIVHFSGHGGRMGLAFHNQRGGEEVVPHEVLREIFELSEASVRLAVLNACFSEAQGKALLDHVDCVVGTSGTISDTDARDFAVQFYGALADGKSVRAAHRAGYLAIETRLAGRYAAAGQEYAAGTASDLAPRLLVRPGVDADALVLSPAED